MSLTETLSLLRNERGATLVEFALIAPLLLALLSGIISYGGWFWMAHALQQAANDAARATLAGLSSTERSTIAATAVRDELRSGGGPIDPTRTTITVEETSEMVTVRVGYDATRSPLLSMSLLPLPSSVIRRSAVVRLSAQ